MEVGRHEGAAERAASKQAACKIVACKQSRQTSRQQHLGATAASLWCSSSGPTTTVTPCLPTHPPTHPLTHSPTRPLTLALAQGHDAARGVEAHADVAGGAHRVVQHHVVGVNVQVVCAEGRCVWVCGVGGRGTARWVRQVWAADAVRECLPCGEHKRLG